MKNQNSRQIAKLQCYGKQTDSFDDSNLINSGSKIKSIEIRSGEIIDSLTVNYENARSPEHGGNGGSIQTFLLDDDEAIVEISGLYGTWWNIEVIKQLTIVTTKKTKTFGSNIYPFASSEFSIKSSKDYPIIGFYGSTISSSHGSYLCQIGAIVLVDESPAFYQIARNNLVLSLYDPIFSQMKEIIGWTDNDDKANIEFNKLKNEITNQSGYFDNPYEAQYFNNVIDKIENTNLFKFLQDLPKGAVLHLHPSSMGDYVDLLQSAAEYVDAVSNKYCWVRFLYKDDEHTIIDPVNTDNNSFQWSTIQPESQDPNLKLGDYMKLKDAFNNPVLKQAAIDLLVLNPSVMDYEGDMWDLFQPVFSRGGVLFKKPELQAAYYQKAFEYLTTTDNLTHAEIRSSWDVTKESKPETPEYCIINAANNANISLKVINFNSRHIDESTPVSTSVLQNVVDTGKAILDPQNKYLCGYDLVGEEDTGATTEFLTNDFYLAYDQLDKFLPPFFFHDGESDLAPDYDPDDQSNFSNPNVAYFNNNLVDAYLLNTLQIDNFQMTTNRVGHGLELFKTPKLFNDYKNANLMVELCPISNQLLRYIKDLREHPGQSYLAAGLPVSISSDDPAIYGYQGISYDFWEAVIGWGLDLRMVKILCYYSLKYSTLNESDKIDKINVWQNKWNEFISKHIE